MAQPSQVFPPWLSPTVVVVTNAGGAPVATETSIEYIAPTYFGPSIPLGTLYSFGGTSEPPTVILPGQTTTSAVATSVTTTATPTTTALTTTSATSSSPTSASSISFSASSSSTASLTSFVSSSLSQSASLTSSSFPSASSTGGVTPIAGHSLSKGQLVGIIVASILAVIVSFVAGITLWLCLKGRRKRRSQLNILPIDDDYEIIPPGGHLPGDGSPRHSGEEGDPFLQHHGGAAIAGPSRAPRVPPPPVASTGSKSSGSTANTGSDSSNSHASGFGVLLDRPSLGYLPITPEHDETTGQPLSPTDMARIQRESVLPDDENQYDENGQYTGAYAISQDPQVPPRLVEPSATTPLLGGDSDNAPFTTQPSYLSEKSSFGSHEEGEPSILTARRIKAEDLGPRTNSESTAGPSHRTSTGFLGALGLGGLANIGRLSWFRNLDSPRNSRAISTPDYTADPLTEKDIEIGRSGLLSPHSAGSFGVRPRLGAGVGTLPDGTRPISSTSARSGASGGTLYHDAQSSLPSTPLLAPLPRALTPAEQPRPPSAEHAWISSPLNDGTSGTPPPPAYTDRLHPASSTPPPHHSSNPDLGNGGSNTFAGDILDMPAPAPLNHFSSISSLKETPTGSSFGNNSTKPTSFLPPGLDSTIRPVGWSSRDSATTASRGSFTGLFGLSSSILGTAMGQGMDQGVHDVSILVDDVLDEAPPGAEQGWRTISSTGSNGGGGAPLGGMSPSDPGRRGTFGLFVPHNPGINSEQGSLHSMRSAFSPSASVRSSGSAPASRRDRDVRMDGSISSNSSRPSAHSVARSMGSGASIVAHSLLRTGSISEDDRRKGYASGGPISPALSAFGIAHHQHRTSSSGEQDYPRQPSSPLAMAPTIGSPPIAYMSPDKVHTVRAMDSGTSAGSATLADTSFETIRPGDGEHVGLLSPPRTTSPPISVSSAPWAGGLDGDWQPAP
ncbi:hypothetical protein CPB84DRAFT_1823828 [Gymnopilus junonius]|uniref:Uncharacterized protein n=1 Tax=Gymnopilus junonius TaxID=109634 RepID=A0A9P5NR80_GYMJU|nr:hypothetical protein CPB84DRAFT_1823828 [Gymnopilus junonius]